MSEQVLSELKVVRNRKIGVRVKMDRVTQKRDGWTSWYYQVSCSAHLVKSNKCRNQTVARDLLHHPWVFCAQCRELRNK